MRYIIARDISASLLEIKVNNLLKQGWKPQGGVLYDCVEQEYLQAMIKSSLFTDDPTDFG